MADKFLNLTAVQTLKTWIEGKFALDSDLDALSDRVDDIVAEGGEPNVIETVKVNGTALTPVNKAVDVTVPTTVAELTDASDYALVADIPTKVSDLTNDGDGTQGSAFATEDYVDQNGGKIDVIKVNGMIQTITNKAVDITVPTRTSNLTNDGSDGANRFVSTNELPTATSDLTNDSEFQTADDVDATIATALANSNDPYQTESDVDGKISTALTSAMTYKGSVATVADLPSSGNKVGDFYNITATDENYAWTGSAWDKTGEMVDTSVLWTSTTGQNNTLEAATVAEINAILNPSS